jgi:hypothetical protein
MFDFCGLAATKPLRPAFRGEQYCANFAIQYNERGAKKKKKQAKPSNSSNGYNLYQPEW